MVSDIDLTNCDREPIHLCGAIQPHGVLVALDEAGRRILFASENVAGTFGADAAGLIGRFVEDLLGATNSALIAAAAERPDIEEGNPIAMSVRTIDGAMRADAALHRSAGKIIVELEPVDAARLTSPHEFHRLVRDSIATFAPVRTVQQLCEALTVEIDSLTGFDRVMVYRFDDQWNGEVVAERHGPGLESYLGLHYPASDIPSQAREIFRRNWLRLIPDVGYVPIAIVPNATETGEPLDLSGATLRSVSPLHIEYLRNMGVAASLTVSLLRNGELWGLIACHHRTPKRVPYQLRLAAELVGRTASLHLGTLEENEDTAYRMKLKSGQTRLLEAMSAADDIWSALVAAESDLLSLVGSDGAAIRFGETCRLVGRTPERADVVAITDWLAANVADDVFVTDTLPTIDERFEPLANTACGVIALALSRARNSYVLWFRPEVVATVDWGGNPAKPVESAPSGVRLTPRKSFALWREVVRLRSRRWTEHEVDAAREWSRFVGTLIVDRAETLEKANRELASANVELASLLRSNVELDAFAHIASHDLKEPLRGIHNYATFLIEDYGPVVGEDGREKLDTLVRLSRRMESLIESLLALSRIGRADFNGIPTPLNAVVADTIETFAHRLAQCGGTVSIVTPLPLVFVDAPRLGQVFGNLIANALKYCERPPRIEIGADSNMAPPSDIARDSSALPLAGKMTTVFVRDNGIGIREKHLTSIFQMFKRLHPNDAYGGGTGAGLAIAKKIVERHAGQMWAESTFGSGSTFYFTLPLEPQK